MLQELLRQLDTTQILLFAAPAICGTLMVWYRKRIAAWRELWRSVINGLRSIPDLQADLKGVCYYVSPNGGGSLMDSSVRMENTLAVLTEQVDLVVHTMWAENDSDDTIGRFYCNNLGENTYVNQTYARWLGVGKQELLEWDYYDYIHPDDIEAVRQHWDTCRAEHRRFRMNYRVIPASGGGPIEVEVSATPIPDGGQTKRWIGAVRRTDYADRRYRAE